MSLKKINITIPEENLKEINEFCVSEKVNKSWLIREATSKYISNISEQRELEKKRKDMEWAIETMEKLRKKSNGFIDGKSGSEVIREFREKR
ncbi:MAG: ribbon-helix-helix protein, CopG family [Actinobacteria bacterium]|nr:ribbon-helix-helix protein, CopG family [Actinomycetota bacterium]